MSQPLSITVDTLGWNTSEGTPVEDHARWICAVLHSAGNALWSHCPNTKLDPIFVRYGDDHPLAHFRRDTQGRIVVDLHASGLEWNKFAYQFAHEFCHVLATQTNDHTKHWHNCEHANHWFEESLCEVASLFVLRRMSSEWRINPTYAQWSTYSAKLRDYARNILDDPKKRLPAGETFHSWFAQNELLMRATPITKAKSKAERDELRARYTLVAQQLLPVFEELPSGWESVTWLNLVPRNGGKTLAQQMADWRLVCSPTQQAFVERVGHVLGLTAIAVLS